MSISRRRREGSVDILHLSRLTARKQKGCRLLIRSVFAFSSVEDFTLLNKSTLLLSLPFGADSSDSPSSSTKGHFCLMVVVLMGFFSRQHEALVQFKDELLAEK